MSIPINSLVFAGIWNVSRYYNKFQFVESPTDGANYLYVGEKILSGGGDPATLQPSSIWIPFNSPSSSVLSQYFLPSGGLFNDLNFWVGPTSATLGSFTLPSDVVAGSTVMLYWVSWNVQNWGPLPNLNVLDFRFGFSDTPSVSSPSWYVPSAGFIVTAPNNANGVPLQIPFIPHTPSNPANPDYIQLPQWVIIPNAQPNQTIYLNLEILYLNDTIQDISVLAPFLLYQKQ